MYFRLRPSEFFRQTGTRPAPINFPLGDEWYSRYSSVQAVLGLAKLKNVKDEDAKRISIAKQYQKMVSNPKIRFPRSTSAAHSVYWQMICFTDDPSALQKYLFQQKIDTGATSLSLLPAVYRNYCLENHIATRQEQPDLVNAKLVYEQSLFIPCYPNLGPAQVSHIINSLNNY